MMNANMVSYAKRTSVLAVQGALLAMMVAPAFAEEPTIAELRTPTNTVEIGVINVDKSSAKFGEYNGLEKDGTKLNGAFDVSGGGGDESAVRYRFIGKDLGLANGNFSAEYGEQGKFRIKFGYDELQKYSSDSYMSPYNGAGSNSLTLPANWATNSHNCIVSGTASGNTNFGGASNATTGGAVGCGNYYISQNTGNNSATPTGNALALTAAEVADFHHVDLQTKRKKADLGVDFIIDARWSFSASARNEVKEGIQAIGSAAAGTTNAQVTVANPIKYDTNEFNFKLAFKGEKAFAEAAYYGSIFKDRIDGFTYQNPYFSSLVPSLVVPTSGPSNGVLTTTNPFADNIRVGTAPSNQFHQLNLTGGYSFSKTTKLVAAASYGRSTQDEDFLPWGTGLLQNLPLPRSSLHGLVVTKALSLKLTARPVKDLSLVAAYKYNERDNRTPVTTYVSPYNPQEQQVVPYVVGIGSNSTTFNLPYSRKTNQLNLEADWAFSKGQALKAGVDYQNINRWCSGITSLVPSCVNSADSKESTWRLEYRNNLLNSVTGRIGYAESKRDASGYLGNMANYVSTEYKKEDLTRFDMTDRKRDKLRTAITWLASEALEFTVGYDFTKDDYRLGKSVGSVNAIAALGYGLDNAKSTAINLDASYHFSEKISLNGYFSDESISSVQKGSAGANGGVNTAGDWLVDAKDKVRTYGLVVRANELVGGKLDLTGDFTTSRASSPYALSAASSYSITANAGTAQINSANSAAFFFPDTYSNSDTLKLSAKYKVSKVSAWRINYELQRLSSADPARYNGLQQGVANNAVNGSNTSKVNGVNNPATNLVPISSLLPTNEQAPNYSVHAVGVTYIYTFN